MILRAAWLVPQGNCCDPPIHCIDLADHNCLNDDDANLISQALKRRNTKGNNFKSIGVKTLLTCIFDSLSLNAISESNHTMTRVHMFHGHNDNLAQFDRMQKIMVALQDKDRSQVATSAFLSTCPIRIWMESKRFWNHTFLQMTNEWGNHSFLLLRESGSCEEA